jgi:hypothetical protein
MLISNLNSAPIDFLDDFFDCNDLNAEKTARDDGRLPAFAKESASRANCRVVVLRDEFTRYFVIISPTEESRLFGKKININN